MGDSLAYFMLDLGSAKTLKDCDGCENIPIQPRREHEHTRTYRGFRSSEIYRLIPDARPWSEVAAFHCRHRADRQQFLGLPGVSRYPLLPAVFRQRQSRRDGRSLGFKLGRFQRRNLAHRAQGYEWVKGLWARMTGGQSGKRAG